MSDPYATDTNGGAFQDTMEAPRKQPVPVNDAAAGALGPGQQMPVNTPVADAWWDQFGGKEAVDRGRLDAAEWNRKNAPYQTVNGGVLGGALQRLGMARGSLAPSAPVSNQRMTGMNREAFLRLLQGVNLQGRGPQ